MPTTIADLRNRAALIADATQVGENTANRVGTAFDMVADLLDGLQGITNVSIIDIDDLDTLNTLDDMKSSTPNIYTITKTIGANTFKVGTLFQFANNGRYDVAQVIISQFIPDAMGDITTTSSDSEVHVYYRLCKTQNGGSLPTPVGTWTTWTEIGSGGGGGITIDAYPTNGSSNAVSSNGVFEKLQDAAPLVDIEDIDDIDDYADMQAGVASYYTAKKTYSGTDYRVGTLMVFCNQGRYIIYQILATDYDLDANGDLDTSSSTNGGMKLIWRMKQFSGVPPQGVVLNQWSAWRYMVQPNNEDIDFDAQGRLQFADKMYEPTDFSGLGRFYIRKNIQNVGGVDKNILTSAHLSEANFIYIIQYDFDLNGATITLPAGCVLWFKGGSVANGTLTGNGTIVKDTDAKIFGNGVTIAGTWKNNIIRSSWFETNNDTLNNILAMNDDRETEIFITENLTAFPSDFNGLEIASNTRVFISSNITKSTSVNEEYSIFGINSAENVSIFGGNIIGTRENAHNTEYGMGVHISDSKNIHVSTAVKNTTGDGIYVTNSSDNIIIENCNFEGNGRNGITIIAAENIEIRNTTFKNVKYKAPMAGIDAEPNTNLQVVRNVLVENCVFENCKNAVTASATNGTIEKIKLGNTSVFSNETIQTLFLANLVKIVMIENCHLVGDSSESYAVAASNANKVIFNNCRISTNKPLNIYNSKTLFLNNILESTGYIFDELQNVMFIKNIISASNAVGNRGFVNVTMFGNTLNIDSLSKTSGTLNNVYAENNTFVFNAAYQCINFSNGNHVRFLNNIFDMTGNRSLVVFNNVNDVIFSHNTIDVKSNQKLFDVSASKDVSIMDNLITLPSTYTFNVYNGVNLLTSNSNRKGDRLFFDSIKKYAIFDGEKWLDDNNFTPALGKGSTADRPAFTSFEMSDIGFPYFDETIFKPIYLKAEVGTDVITKTNISKNIVDDVYYGVNEPNTLTENALYMYVTTYHTARTFKASFRKTNNLAYDDADEILIAESQIADNVAFKAPDNSVYPYIFFCNKSYDNVQVTAYIKNVDMSWVDATGTAV